MPQVTEDSTHRGQDVRLRDEAIGETGVAALRGGLCPRHLEPREWLGWVGTGHLPGEVARDVGVVELEGRGQVFGLGEHFGERWAWWIVCREGWGGGTGKKMGFRLKAECPS